MPRTPASPAVLAQQELHVDRSGSRVTEGRIDLDVTVLSYFPEFDVEITDQRSRRTKVRHVASMASGHADETVQEAYRTR